MNSELLSWFGNLLNLLIVIYLITATITTKCFSYSQALLSAFGLLVSVLIQFRNVTKRW